MYKENIKNKSEYPLTNLDKWSRGNTRKFFHVYTKFGTEEFAPLDGYHAYWRRNLPILIKNKEGIVILHDNYLKINYE